MTSIDCVSTCQFHIIDHFFIEEIIMAASSQPCIFEICKRRFPFPEAKEKALSERKMDVALVRHANTLTLYAYRYVIDNRPLHV